MKKMDDSRPMPSDGLSQAGLLAEIRSIKSIINYMLVEIEKVEKIAKVRK